MLAGLAIPFAAALAIARVPPRFGAKAPSSTRNIIPRRAVHWFAVPGTMFSTQAATLTDAIGRLITNLLIVPASVILLLLATAGNQRPNPTPAATPGGTPLLCGRGKPRETHDDPRMATMFGRR
jgi:hypothetical protein